MTQQEIVDRVNKLTLNYNNSWDDIKYDVDNAVLKINAFLGADYPKPSELMVLNDSKYVVVTDNDYEYPPFPDVYFITVVIPFVASEILARDEEFTTIYNKYVQDYMDGLYDMFQNEFNKVPMEFRQSKDVGVFFANGTPQKEHICKQEKLLPKITFKVLYHVNNEDILTDFPAPTDLTKYPYGLDTKYKIVNDFELDKTFGISVNGMYAYVFKGWSTVENAVYSISSDYIKPGTEITGGVFKNVNYYAVWDKVRLFNITNTGDLSINESENTNKYLEHVTSIIMPNFYEGYRISNIVRYFCGKSKPILPNCQSIMLPKGLTSIGAGAFTRFIGSSIKFTKSNIDVYISATAFTFLQNDNINTIYIPNNCVAVGDNEKGCTWVFGHVKTDTDGELIPDTSKVLKVYMESLYVNSRFNDDLDLFVDSTQVEWGWNNYGKESI